MEDEAFQTRSSLMTKERTKRAQTSFSTLIKSELRTGRKGRLAEGGHDGGSAAALCERSVCGAEVTYSVAPAAQHVVGQGVLRLQLDGFIQVVLGGQRHR